jgi:hypothetical protein
LKSELALNGKEVTGHDDLESLVFFPEKMRYRDFDIIELEKS